MASEERAFAERAGMFLGSTSTRHAPPCNKGLSPAIVLHSTERKAQNEWRNERVADCPLKKE